MTVLQSWQHTFRCPTYSTSGLLLLLLTVPLVCAASGESVAREFFVDSKGGDDSYEASSPERPWKSIDRVNKTTFQPGDRISFKRNCIFYGNLVPRGSGTQESPIIIDSYGDGINPILDAAGKIAVGQLESATLRLLNQEYWTIRNLKIMNYLSDEQPVKRKVVEHSQPQLVNSNKYGILIEGRDCRVLRGIKLSHLEVSFVNGNMGNKDSGGVFFTITRSEDEDEWVPTKFDGILVENCHIHHVDRTGLSNNSVWRNRSLHSHWREPLSQGTKGESNKKGLSSQLTHDWFPSSNIVIRNNRIENTGANGMIIRVAENPLVERNVFSHCGIKGSGNAFFFFNCNAGVCQYNEASFTKFNTAETSWDGREDHDAAGFDSDYQSKNSVFQYNYSHDNEYGGILVCCMTGDRFFNDGTIVRYNVFENNAHHSIRVSGRTTNTLVHNNVIFVGPQEPINRLVWHKSWRGYSEDTQYLNNVFVHEGKQGAFRMEESIDNVFSHNVYWGTLPETDLADTAALRADPLFTSTNRERGGFDCLSAYQLQEESPLIGSGKRVFGHPHKDLFGTLLSTNSMPSRGVSEFR